MKNFIGNIFLFCFMAVIGWGIFIPLCILGIVFGAFLTATIVLAVFGIPIIGFCIGGIALSFYMPFHIIAHPGSRIGHKEKEIIKVQVS